MSEKEKKGELADDLAHLLADTYVLALKTQNYHWNVTGPFFPSFHKLFEEQYSLLIEASDAIAERIRTLGFIAPGGCAVFSKLSKLKEETGAPSAEEMVKNLASDHCRLIEIVYEIIEASQEEGDEGTTDFLVERLREHEKTLWMLESTIKA